MKKTEKTFYALVCEEAGIGGAFITRQEALAYEIQQEIEFCPAKHKILKAKIIILNK